MKLNSFPQTLKTTQWRAQDVNIGGAGGGGPRGVLGHDRRKIFEIWISEMALFAHSDSTFERNPRNI